MSQVTYVHVDGRAQVVDVAIGENVMRGAHYNGVDGIIGECGGGLACATCHCYVDDAWAEKVGSPTSQEETDMLGSASAAIKPTSRLSCQIVMVESLDGLIVHLPDSQY